MFTPKTGATKPTRAYPPLPVARRRRSIPRMSRRGPRFLRLGLLAASAWLVPLEAAAMELRVRAQPSLGAIRTQSHASGVEVTGSLFDETQAPLEGHAIELLASGARSRSCDRDEARAVTDARGRFCFLLEGPLPDRARLRYAGTEFFERAERDIALDVSPPPIELRLDLTTATWDVAGPAQRVRVALLSVDEIEPYPVRLFLVRDGGSRVVLGETQTPAGSRDVEFDVPPERFGALGPATLTAVLGEELPRPLATGSVPVVVASRVDLAWRDPPKDVRPELGFELAADVNTPRGPVDSGWVEARYGDEIVGSAEVRNGVSRVSCRVLAPDRGRPFEISLRYVQEQPWLRPGPDLSLELGLARIPLSFHLPWLLVAGWLATRIVRSWRRPARSSAPSPSAEPSPGVPEGIRVLEVAAAASGWRGTLQDTHTGHAVPGASVAIVLPSALSVQAAVETTSDEAGAFSLPDVPHLLEGARLIVEAPHHSRLAVPVPPRGQLAVGLTSRRRTLLGQLLRWAESRGWGRADVLTPAQVAQAASRLQQPETEAWARQIEGAVFGPEAPDARREEELAHAAPSHDPSQPLKR